MEEIFEQFLSDCDTVKSLVQFSNKVSAYQYRKPFTIYYAQRAK